MMNTIQVKVISEKALAYLKTNIEQFIELFNSNRDSGDWIHSALQDLDEPIFVDKPYRIPDFELHPVSAPNDYNLEYKNGIILYNALKGLPPYLLGDIRFWVWLIFEKAYKESLNMMELSDKESSYLNQLFGAQGPRRGIFQNVLARIWARIHCLVELDDFELCEYVGENPYRFRDLGWRSISNYQFFNRGYVQAIKEVNSMPEFCDKECNKIYPILIKEVTKLGSIKCVDIMSKDEVCEFVRSKYIAILRSKKSA